MKTSSPVIFLRVLAANGLPAPVQEHKFHPTRGWRFDYAWPEYKVALEVEGGVWTGGRHTRGKGFMADLNKYNEANVLRWHVLKTVPDQLCDTTTIEMLRAMLVTA
jgi:hypothetical protein